VHQGSDLLRCSLACPAPAVCSPLSGFHTLHFSVLSILSPQTPAMGLRITRESMEEQSGSGTGASGLVGEACPGGRASVFRVAHERRPEVEGRAGCVRVPGPGL